MRAATVQWDAIGGVSHAWIPQCEGYISLCGREVTGLQGQRSGIRCGACAASSGWAEQTGQESYLTPHPPFGSARPDPMVPLRSIRLGLLPDALEVNAIAEPVHAARSEIPAEAERGLSLQAPESLAAYQVIPEAEQRYWAPVMLARLGEIELWVPTQETAEAFQSRCYERIKESYEIPQTPGQDERKDHG